MTSHLSSSHLDNVLRSKDDDLDRRSTERRRGDRRVKARKKSLFARNRPEERRRVERRRGDRRVRVS